MKYIIADPEEQSCIDLKKLLDDYEILDFQGSFTTLEATKNSIREEPPDIAFVRMGKVKLNAFKLVGEVRRVNLFAKVIFLSNNKEYAVEAFECAANGFLLVPFIEKQIKQLMLRIIEKRRTLRS